MPSTYRDPMPESLTNQFSSRSCGMDPISRIGTTRYVARDEPMNMHKDMWSRMRMWG